METNTQNEFEIDVNMVSLVDLIMVYNESQTQTSTEDKAISKRENEQALMP